MKFCEFDKTFLDEFCANEWKLKGKVDNTKRFYEILIKKGNESKKV